MSTGLKQGAEPETIGRNFIFYCMNFIFQLIKRLSGRPLAPRCRHLSFKIRPFLINEGTIVVQLRSIHNLIFCLAELLISSRIACHLLD
jgi:hypothetical protein